MVALSQADSTKWSELVRQLHCSTNNRDGKRFGDDYEHIAKKVEKSPRVINDADILQIISEYNSGALVKDLAGKYGCHRTRISKILTDHSIPIVRRSRLPASEINRILELYKEGLSSRKIQAATGIGYKTVQLIVRQKS